MQQQIFSAREEQTTKANKSLYILRTLGKLDGYDRQSEIDLLFYTIVLPNINSPVSSSLWPLNDAFFTGLASIWNNKFTNSNEKKDLFITLSIVIFTFQTLTCRNFWIFYFMSRLTLYECPNCLYSAVNFNSKLNYTLSVYVASESDLTPLQCFFDRCFKRKYTSKPASVYDFSERQDCKIFRKVSNTKGHSILSIPRSSSCQTVQL